MSSDLRTRWLSWALLAWPSSCWPVVGLNSIGPALEAASGRSFGGVIVLWGLTPLPKDILESEEIPVELPDAVLSLVLSRASGAACGGVLAACRDGSAGGGEEFVASVRPCPSSASGLAWLGVGSVDMGDVDAGTAGVPLNGWAIVGGSSTTVPGATLCWRSEISLFCSWDLLTETCCGSRFALAFLGI